MPLCWTQSARANAGLQFLQERSETGQVIGASRTPRTHARSERHLKLANPSELLGKLLPNIRKSAAQTIPRVLKAAGGLVAAYGRNTRAMACAGFLPARMAPHLCEPSIL